MALLHGYYSDLQKLWVAIKHAHVEKNTFEVIYDVIKWCGLVADHTE